MTTPTGETTVVSARPSPAILKTGIISVAVGFVPTSVALYAVAVPAGNAAQVLIIQAAALVGAVLIGLRQLSVFVRVTPTTLSGNGIFSITERVALTDIRRVLLVTTYTMQAPDPVVQLLVLGDDGVRLFRLRGNFWPAGALEQVAAALPVRTEVVRAPMTATRFFTNYPGSAYWFENKASVRAVTVLGGCLVAVGVAAYVMLVLGR